MDPLHTYRRQVAAAIRVVRAAGDGPVELADLAAAAGASPAHFDRVFRRMTGTPAVRYARSFRLAAAAVQLVQTDRRIVAVAISAGYANHESFSRAFRHRFGTTPRAYRKRHRSARPPHKEPTMKNLGVSFGFVKIPVVDFAAATAFYRDVLGLTEDFAVEQYGWAQLRAGDTPICLFVVDRSTFATDDPELGGRPATPGVDTGIQLRVVDARAAHAAIARAGGKVGRLNTGDDGTVGFAVADPDGNKLSVAQVPAA